MNFNQLTILLPSYWASDSLATAPTAAKKRVDFQLAILLNPGTIFTYGWGKDSYLQESLISIEFNLLLAIKA